MTSCAVNVAFHYITVNYFALYCMQMRYLNKLSFLAVSNRVFLRCSLLVGEQQNHIEQRRYGWFNSTITSKSFPKQRLQVSGPQVCGSFQLSPYAKLTSAEEKHLHSSCPPIFCRNCSGYKDCPIYLSKTTTALVESPQQLCKDSYEVLSLAVNCCFSVAKYFPRKKAQGKSAAGVAILHSFSFFSSTGTCPTLYQVFSSVKVLFQLMTFTLCCMLVWLSLLCHYLKDLIVS